MINLTHDSIADTVDIDGILVRQIVKHIACIDLYTRESSHRHQSTAHRFSSTLFVSKDQIDPAHHRHHHDRHHREHLCIVCTSTHTLTSDVDERQLRHVATKS